MLKPVDIRKEWNRVKEGLERIICNTGASYLPEDVFAMCVSGEASLWMDTETGAFCVLQKRGKDFSKEPVLFIFAAWTPNTLSVEDYWPQIREIAESIGAGEVKMISARKGWERRPEWEFEYACFGRRV